MSSTILTELPSVKQFSTIPYQVIHTTIGRIRVRIPKLAKDAEYANRLAHLIQAFPCVTEIAINPTAMSVTIHYKANQVSNTDIQEKLETTIQKASAPTISPHTTSALAKRLGVTSQALTWHRSQPDFAEWSCVRDPEGIAWNYDVSSKSFCSIESCLDLTPFSAQNNPILLAIGGAASSKVGGMVGKVAGEVIGLLLLGSAGMVMGAEVGAFLGEVVGAELGNML